MLTDKWVDDAKRLTRTGRTQYNGATERIDDMNLKTPNGRKPTNNIRNRWRKLSVVWRIL